MVESEMVFAISFAITMPPAHHFHSCHSFITLGKLNAANRSIINQKYFRRKGPTAVDRKIRFVPHYNGQSKMVFRLVTNQVFKERTKKEEKRKYVKMLRFIRTLLVVYENVVYITPFDIHGSYA